MTKNKFSDLIKLSIPLAVLSINTITSEAADVYKVSSNEAVNVREGASKSDKVVKKLYPEETVLIEDSSSTWYKTSSKEYIYSSYLSKSTEEYEVTAKIGITVRETPNGKTLKNSNGKDIELKRNTIVNVHSIDDGWAKIDYRGTIAYIKAEFLDKVREYYEVTRDSGAIVRSSANSSSSQLGTIPKGTIINVSHKTNHYAIIRYNGQRAFVSLNSISSLEREYKVTNKNGATIRKEVGSDSKKLGTLSYNSKIKVNHVSRHTNSSDKIEGWASFEYNGERAYVKLSDIALNTNPDIEYDGTYYTASTSSDKVIIREAGDKDSKKITSLKNRTEVEVLSVNPITRWAKVNYSDGTGYCFFDYLTIVNPNNSVSKAEKQKTMIEVAKDQLGKKYLFGTEGLETFDCSSLMRHIYKKGANVDLPRTATEQAQVGKTININNSSLLIGDLLFFNSADIDEHGNVRPEINHVGMYIGNGRYIHAPRKNDAVRFDRVDDAYFKNNLVKVQRIL